jgi:hypothetical protein
MILVFFAGMRRTKVDRNDYDYSSFLGPDYKDEPLPPVIPTYVCNHASWLDVANLITYYAPAFVAKKSLRKVPVFGLLC